MNIKIVTPTDSDFTLGIPLSILSGLNADFDGDVLNIVAMINREINYLFRKFDPIRRMMISRDTGYLNPYFSIQKGQLIDLLFFCTMGKMKGDREEVYEAGYEMPESNYDTINNVPIIRNHKEVEELLQPVYIIENELESKDSFDLLLTKIYNILKGSFVIKECRELPVKFKFRQKEKKTYTLELRHFLVNLMLWEPMIELNEFSVCDETFIFDCMKDVPKIDDYINYKIITGLREYHINGTTINYALSSVLYNLRSISINFSQIMNLNFSLITFMDLYKIPEMREMMDSEFTINEQPYEIENRLKEMEAKTIKILTGIKDHPLGVILSSGQGIKHKQLIEFLETGGLNPTLTGETVPIPMSNSILIGGPNKASTYWISAISSRKSLVLNKKVIKFTCHLTSLIAGNSLELRLPKCNNI